MKVLERIDSLHRQFAEEAAVCADHVESWRAMLGAADGDRQIKACEGAIDVWRDRMATAHTVMELLRELRQQCEAKGLKDGDDGNPHKPDWLDQLLRDADTRDTGSDDDSRAGFMKGLSAVMADVKAKALGPGSGGSGSVPCPDCGTGHILYSVASCNGHVWGQCTTKGCLTWMQ